MANKVEILNLDIDTSALITKLAETKKQIDNLQASQRELSKAGETSSTQFVEQAAQLQNLQRSYNSQKNVVAQLTNANKQNETATKALNDAIDKEIKSVSEAAENNKKLTIIRNQLNLATNEGREALKLINEKINQNTEFIRENVSAQEKQRMQIGNYSEQIKDALSNLNPFNGGIAGFTERAREAGGAGSLLKDSFSQLSTGIFNATKAAVTFIATPVGAIITGIVAAFAAGKAIFDFNKGLQESNLELKALGVNSGEISKVRDEIRATAETYDKDFKEIAEKANSLSKSFGISMSEANDIIAQGLANGGAQNQEFLDSLGEYDQFFAKAGYSAKEFANIINTGYELGVYSDKLPDALKEADLALKEQTKASRDALVNAFGASFSDDILKKVRTGELTTKEALQAIADQSQKTQLTQQQQAQLTADVFKGAGEDAGGAMKIFEAISKSANTQLSETAKKQIELQEATERLNQAQSELFEIKDFGDIWTSIKTVGIDALASIIQYVSDVKKDIQPLIDLVSVVLANAWASLKTSVTVAFNVIKANLQIVTNVVSTFFNFFKALVTGDFQGAINALKNGFNNLLNIVSNTFGKIKNSILNGLKSVVDNISPLLKAVGVDVDKLQKKLDGLKSKEVTTKSKTENTTTNTSKNSVVNDVDPNAAANAKASADAAKKQAEEKQKLIDAAIQKQKDELNLFLANQGIKKKSLEDELRLEEQILAKKLSILDAEFRAKKITETAYQAESLKLKNEFAKKQADTAVTIAQQELDEYKRNHQLKLDQDKFFDDEKLRLVIQSNNDLAQKEIEFQALKLEQGVINQQQYNDAIDAINEATRIKNEEADKLREQAKKEKQAIDLENQRIIDEENFTNEFDLQLAREDQRYQAELQTAEKTGADINLIKKKHAQVQNKIEEEKNKAILQGYANTFSNIAQLLGENTDAGKAAAIAQATINTYLGVTQVLSAPSILPEPAGSIAKIAQAGVILGTGLVNVNKILNTKTPKFADGGEVPRLSSGLINSGSNLSVPLSNGDDTLAFVGQGEVILNREQQARAGGAAFFKSLGVPGFANGGLVGGNTNLNLSNGIKIDYDLLAVKLAQANASLPAPVVSVQEINYTQNQVRLVESGANF